MSLESIKFALQKKFNSNTTDSQILIDEDEHDSLELELASDPNIVLELLQSTSRRKATNFDPNKLVLSDNLQWKDVVKYTIENTTDATEENISSVASYEITRYHGPGKENIQNALQAMGNKIH